MKLETSHLNYTTPMKNGWKLQITFCIHDNGKFVDVHPSSYIDMETLQEVHKNFHDVIEAFGLPSVGDNICGVDTLTVINRDFDPMQKLITLWIN